jgi:putative glutamine amidotransferase
MDKVSRRVAFTYGREDPNWPAKVAPYLEALQLAGLEPVLCLPGSSPDLKNFAGLVLGGGADIAPSLYGQQPAPETEAPEVERDQMELDLLAAANAGGLPHLAICRGLQLFNVFHGGTLRQHIGYGHRQRGVADAHRVTVAAESKLGRMIGTNEFTVNSRHHQAVDRVAAPLIVSARADDQTVEGLERPDHPFAIAVQWHPEDRVRTHVPDQRLFSAFARAC